MYEAGWPRFRRPTSMWERPSGPERPEKSDAESKLGKTGLTLWTLTLLALWPQDCRTHVLLCMPRLPASISELYHRLPWTAARFCPATKDL